MPQMNTWYNDATTRHNMERIDAEANSMKAAMNATRRKLEAKHGDMLCATCDKPAAKGSCYCDECEAREFADQ